MLKCNHQCHCACRSEMETLIIYDAGRQAAHKKTSKIHVLKVNINFQRKKKSKITKLNDIIPLSFTYNKNIKKTLHALFHISFGM